MRLTKPCYVFTIALLNAGCGGGSTDDGAAQEALDEACMNDPESVACADFCENNPQSEFCI